MELYAADVATEVGRGLLDVTAHVDGAAIRCLSCSCEPRLLAHSRDSWQWRAEREAQPCSTSPGGSGVGAPFGQCPARRNWPRVPGGD